jgi:hypothetical protein
MLDARAAIRAAPELPLPRDVVETCLGDDELFRRAWRDGLGSLAPAERRGRLCVDIGSIAEGVATLLLRDAGLDVFAQMVEHGVHGVDALALAPDGSVLAVEVKGTLRAGTIPRLGRSARRQMSVEWLDDPRNPAMAEWDLHALDIYGAIAVVDFTRVAWRAAVTSDYECFTPVQTPEQLRSPSSLQAAAPTPPAAGTPPPRR